MVGFRYGLPRVQCPQKLASLCSRPDWALSLTSCGQHSIALGLGREAQPLLKGTLERPGSDLWPAREHASARLRHLSGPIGPHIPECGDVTWESPEGLSLKCRARTGWETISDLQLLLLTYVLPSGSYLCQLTTRNRKLLKGLIHKEENHR